MMIPIDFVSDDRMPRIVRGLSNIFLIAIIISCSSQIGQVPQEGITTTTSEATSSSTNNGNVFENSTFVVDTNPFPPASIVWSPLRNEIGITSINAENSASKIYIYNFELMELREILSDFYPTSLKEFLDWSNDGRKVYIWYPGHGLDRTGRGIWEIDLYNPDDQILVSPGSLGAISNVGKMAIMDRVFIRNRITIDILDMETGKVNQILNHVGLASERLSWSPTGEKIVFNILKRSRPKDSDIYVLSTNDSDITQITMDGNSYAPDWSPIGNLIAYVKFRPEEGVDYKLHVMKSDGSCDIYIPDLGDVFSPIWSPDGKQIAYVSYEGIYIMDLMDVFKIDEDPEWPCR